MNGTQQTRHPLVNENNGKTNAYQPQPPRHPQYASLPQNQPHPLTPPQAANPPQPLLHTFPLWLLSWATGWLASYALGLLLLQWYNGAGPILWLTQIPWWQTFLLFGAGKLGGDGAWRVVKKWQGRG